ncbi:MAG: hypothetical protein QM757_44085 [Paludibaculum sp.]
MQLDMAKGSDTDVIGGFPGGDDLPVEVVNCQHATNERIEAAIVHAAVRAAAKNKSVVAVIMVTRFTNDIPERVDALLQQVKLPRFNFILWPQQGRPRLHLPAFGVDTSVDQAISDRPSKSAENTGYQGSIFTPTTLWVVKAILYNGIPRSAQWWVHTRTILKSLQDFAGAGGFSLATASRTMSVLERDGWVEWKRGQRPVLVRCRELLDAMVGHAWLRRLSTKPLYVRPVFDAPDELSWDAALAWLRRGLETSTESPVRIGGWASLAHLHMNALTDTERKHVHIIMLSKRPQPRQLQLVETYPTEALFTLTSTPDPVEFVGQSHVGEKRHDDLYWSDPLQAALDVSADSGQGSQQAQAVIARLSDEYKA